jgi:hypothetical protein
MIGIAGFATTAQLDYQVSLRIRQPKLKPYENLMRKFRYRDSLDAVMAVCLAQWRDGCSAITCRCTF